MKALLGLLVIVSLAAAAINQVRIQGMQRQARELRVEAANAHAAADSSVLEVRTEADSQVAVATRLAFQGDVELREAFQVDRSALEDSLATVRGRLDRIAQVSARFRVEADSLKLEVSGLAAERDDLGNLTVVGEIDARDSLGVHVTAQATIPARPGARVLWAWKVTKEPLSLELALSCLGSIAEVQLAGPAWAPLVIDSVAQVPEICNPLPTRRWEPLALRLPSLPVGTGLVMLGALLAGLLR